MKEKLIGRTLQAVIGCLAPTQHAAVESHAAMLIQQELSLSELRKKLELTQVEVARRLKKGQDEVSRIEQRGDVLLSTLNEYVRALGGELELVCRFKDRPPVRITSVAAAMNGTKRRRKHVKS